jgi:hypothetical protein
MGKTVLTFWEALAYPCCFWVSPHFENFDIRLRSTCGREAKYYCIAYLRARRIQELFPSTARSVKHILLPETTPHTLQEIKSASSILNTP